MIIGVTGRVGVGKSYLVKKLNIKSELFHTIDLDLIGHQLLEDQYVKEKLMIEFGKEILDGNNMISRPDLSRVVFEGHKQLSVLNQIMHPKIKDEVLNSIKSMKEKNIIIVGALIKEINLVSECNYIVCVQADRKKREQILNKKIHIERFQLDDAQYKEFSDTIFLNDYTKESVDKFIDLIQNLILFSSKEKK
ncbi:dephospho-CoA kinase [bacterium]|nr:dephospho-CoA kinase [bacterium]